MEKLRRGERLSDEEIEVLLLFIARNMVIDRVDNVVDKRLESRLKRYRKVKERGVKDVTGILGRVLGDGEARFVFKAIKDGETQSVLHQIFGPNGFTYRGNEYQFDIMSEGKRVDRWRKKRSGH